MRAWILVLALGWFWPAWAMVNSPHGLGSQVQDAAEFNGARTGEGDLVARLPLPAGNWTVALTEEVQSNHRNKVSGRRLWLQQVQGGRLTSLLVLTAYPHSNRDWNPGNYCTGELLRRERGSAADDHCHSLRVSSFMRNEGNAQQNYIRAAWAAAGITKPQHAIWLDGQYLKRGGMAVYLQYFVTLESAGASELQVVQADAQEPLLARWQRASGSGSSQQMARLTRWYEEYSASLAAAVERPDKPSQKANPIDSVLPALREVVPALYGASSSLEALSAPRPNLPSPPSGTQRAPGSSNAIQSQPVVTAVPRLEGSEAARLNIVSHRKALVIGNDQYTAVSRLENAVADAEAMAASLSNVGYTVYKHLNVSEKNFKQVLRDFKMQVAGGDEVLFFFAGHGVQLGNVNYLLPVDIRGQDAEQVRDDAIALQRVLDDLEEKKVKFALAVIDACRDNPFKGSGRAIGGRGLAPTTAATGQMIIFSAGSGQQALDRLGPSDKERNGLFTRIFLKEMQKPGVSVDRVLRSVRNEVVRLARSIGHEQTPALYDQSVGEFYFRN